MTSHILYGYVQGVLQNPVDEKNASAFFAVKGAPMTQPNGEVRRTSSIKTNRKEENQMADFVQKTVVKSAVRKLATPIENVAAFNTIVQSVLTDNPFACTAYESAGVNHAPVEKSKENYVAKVVYQDGQAKTVGTDSSKFNTIAGFNAGATALLNNTALATAHGGTPIRDTPNETYSATLKCHDASGELFMVTFTRSAISISSYSDDAIRTRVETWADTVEALA